MPFDIIHDIEKGIAAIIDPQTGRALGPVALGEDAVKVLESFAGIHGVDPATLPQHTLESRWEKFVSDIADIQGTVEGAVDEIEGKPASDGAAPTDHKDTSGETAPPTQAALDQAAAAEHTATHGPGTATAVPTSAQAPADTDTIPAVPGPGQVICPTCDGFRTVIGQGAAEVQCPTCKGAGVVEAHQERQPGATPTA
jgi:hypothetical protein